MKYLEALRQSAPDHGRHQLIAVWEQEAATERATFLATLRIQLSEQDIPFLEKTLTDRSLQVRTVAAHLLAAVPGTTLRETLLGQLTTIITVERGWLKRKLQVNLPNTFTDEWKQWGLREQSPLGVRIGQKTGWLVQLIALVPPSALVEALGLDAIELFELIRASDYAEALLTALLEGAENHEDYAFLVAELRHLLRLLELSQIQQSELIERFARYAPTLPPMERMALLQRYLDLTHNRAFGDWATLQMVLRHFEQLSPTVTTTLLANQLPTLLRRNTRDYGIGRVWLDLAYQLDPIGYPQAHTLFTPHQGEERPEYVERFLQIYDLRHQVAEAFNQ